MTSSPADWYLRFADAEAHGRSAVYEEWARGVASDAQVLELIAGLPEQKQQPNLIFATARLLGADVGRWPAFRRWLLEHWPEVAREARRRSTQTNEPGRCAVLLPALCLLPQPIALIEIGASAGLTLLPDRYAYSFDDEVRLGESPLVLPCATSGDAPLPRRLPHIRWGCGIDLAPLDVTGDEDMRWLETLLWPEQDERRSRLHTAIDLARADPPRIVEGDAVDALRGAVGQVPAGLTPVVVSSGTLAYVPGRRRAEFRDLVRELGSHWVSLE